MPTSKILWRKNKRYQKCEQVSCSLLATNSRSIYFEKHQSSRHYKFETDYVELATACSRSFVVVECT